MRGDELQQKLDDLGPVYYCDRCESYVYPKFDDGPYTVKCVTDHAWDEKMCRDCASELVKKGFLIRRGAK